MLVVVSGASRGIGLALVKEYLSASAKVIAVCRDPDGAGDLNALRRDYPALTVLQGDVADARSIDAIRSALGERPVDLLLNVAGTA